MIIMAGVWPGSAQNRADLTEKEVLRVHEKSLTIDTHCDTPMNMLKRNFDVGRRNNTGKVDLPRMKEGDWMPCFCHIHLPASQDGNEHEGGL